MLLGPVVQVAFQATAFEILRVHQPLARCAQVVEAGLQVGAQTDVLEHQSGLVRKVVDELLPQSASTFRRDAWPR